MRTIFRQPENLLATLCWNIALVNRATKEGKTPLLVTVDRILEAVVDILLELGAASTQDKGSWTCLATGIDLCLCYLGGGDCAVLSGN